MVRARVRALIQPVHERPPYVGMVEEAEVVGTGHVQEIGVRGQLPASMGGVLADQKVTERPRRQPTRGRSGAAQRAGDQPQPRVGQTGAASRSSPRSRLTMPTERRSMIRPKADVSGSRAKPAEPDRAQPASGAPRWGVPSVTTSVTRGDHRTGPSASTAQAIRATDPHRVPHKGDPPHRNGPGVDHISEQGGQQGAVVLDGQAGVDAAASADSSLRPPTPSGR